MRGGKGFLVLVVLALGLGGYAYFVESKRDPSSDTPAVKRDKVMDLDASKVEEIEVRSATGDVTRLKKTGADWHIVAPEALEADQEVVSTILQSITSLEATSTVDEHPASVKAFDLDPAHVSVGLQLTGEKTMKRLSLGTKTPTGADVYARVEGQPKVVLVSASTEDQINRSLFDLREKSLLKFDREKADSLKLEPTGAPAVAFTKKNPDDWRLTAPVEAKADFSVVDGLVGRLSQARMKSVVESDGTKDLKKYGLDKPQAVATIGVGSTRASLALGTKAPDGTIYGRDLTRPLIFTVEAALLDDLKKKTDDLRQKMMFEFRSFTAVSVDIAHGAEAFTFVKGQAPAAPNATTPPIEVWKQSKPAAKDIDSNKLTDFLVDLANLKAESFVDRPVASTDEYVFTIRFGDDKAPKDERVTVRKSGAVVHAIRQGDAGAAVIPTADFDKVVTGLKGLAGGK